MSKWIPGGLVERYGLRACPRSAECRSGCVLARQRRSGSEILYTPSTLCEFMSGPRPLGGEVQTVELARSRRGQR
jgi:hypothetical protein